MPRRGPRNTRTDYYCNLCPDTPDAYSTIVLDDLLAHVKEAHAVTEEALSHVQRRAFLFIDGKGGSAQQHYEVRLPDDRVFLLIVWSSGVFAEGAAQSAFEMRRQSEARKALTAHAVERRAAMRAAHADGEEAGT